MWQRRRILYSSALLFAFCAPVFSGGIFAVPRPQESSVGSDGTQIRISLTTSKQTYALGEPIILKFEITNVGKVPVLVSNNASVNVRADAPTSAHLDLELEDAHGRSSPAMGLIADSFGIPSAAPPIRTLLRGWLLLKPHSSYKTTATIDRELFEFLGKLGRYRLSGAYISPDLFDRSTSHQLGLTDEDVKAIPAPCWSGRLKLKPITFEIAAK